MLEGSANVVIVAAGESRRMGKGPSKVLRLLAGRPLLSYSLTVFQQSPLVERIVIVSRLTERDEIATLVRDSGATKAQGHWAPGGASRADSVLSGLDYLRRQGAAPWVLVQDAARPFVRCSMVEESLRAAARTGAAVVAIPARDTIKEASGEDLLVRTLDRRCLWQVQTPQTFRFELLWNAYQKLPPGHHEYWTDDAMVLELQGIPSAIVMGDVTNVKITTPDDLLWAEFLLERRPQLLDHR